MRAFILALCFVVLSVLAQIKLAGRSDSFCVLQTDGQNYCVGNNYYGNLGIASNTATSYPTRMLLVNQATDICTSFMHSCVVDQDQVKCTGDNTDGKLGVGSTVSSNVLLPVVDNVNKVFCGKYSTCALLQNGTATCWGSSSFGVLGVGTISGNVKSPTAVSSVNFENSPVKEISNGDSHTCFLTEAGKLFCAGYNRYMALGDGTQTNQNVPVRVQGVGVTATFISVSCDMSHTCAVTADSYKVYCWGDSGTGALGLGSGILNSYVL